MKQNYIIGSVAVFTALLAVSQAVIAPEQIDSSQIPEARAVSFADFPTHPAKSDTELSEGWIVINNNEDKDSYDEEITWRPIKDYDTNNNVVKTGYTPSGGGDMDDYLISPSVEMEAGKTYTVVMNYRMGGWSDRDNLAVYLSTSIDPEEIKKSEKIFANEDAYVSSYTDQKITLTPALSGEYHLVFHCFSTPYQSGVWISEVRFVENVAPSPVTNLTATPASDNSISCTLNWELPTTDVLGGELTGENAIEKVLVYRDGSETPVELSADATSYIDTEDSGLTPGKHNYSVTVLANGTESEVVSVTTSRIGPAQAIVIPAKISFESEDDFEGWTVIHGEGSTTADSWKFNDVRLFASFSIGYWSTDNDWLIAPPVKVEEAGYFKVNILGVMESGSEANFTLVKGYTPEEISLEAFSPAFSLPFGDSWTTDYPKTGYDIYLEPGTYYFGIHNKLGKNNPNIRNNFTYYIKGLEIEASSYTPGKVTGLSAKGAEDLSNSLVVTWKNPEIDMAGQSMEGKEYVVKLYINNDKTPSVIIEDGSEVATINVPSSGSYNVTAVVETPDGTASSEAVSVKSAWVGDPTVELPYSTTFIQDEDPAIEIWESFAVDGNDDGKKFYYKNSSFGSYLTIDGGTGEYLDFILSPYMNLTPGNYKVSYKLSGGALYNIIPVIVGSIKAGTFDVDNYSETMNILLERELDDYGDFNLSSFLEIDEEGMYQIVFGEVGSRETDYGELQISQFAIDKVLAYPANVSDLRVLVDPENEDAAIISWTNPSTIFGSEEPLSAIEAVMIERDGEVVGSLTEGLVPGESSSFIDQLEAGGKYTYTVYATFEGKGHGEGYAFIKTSWIGGGLLAPVSMDANDERWTIIDSHNDTQEKEFYTVNGWYNSNNLLCYLHEASSENPADDYLLTPPVKVKEDEIYKITFEAEPHGWADQKNYTASVKMGLGSDHSVLPEVATVEIPKDASNNELKEYSFYVTVGENETPMAIKARENRAAEEESNTVGKDDELYISAVKIPTGSHTIALHCATNGGGIRVGSFKFEKVADIDLSTGIENVNGEEIYIKNNVIFFPGIVNVKMYDISGSCVASADKCKDSFILPELTPGYYIVTIGCKAFKIIIK